MVITGDVQEARRGMIDSPLSAAPHPSFCEPLRQNANMTGENVAHQNLQGGKNQSSH